MKKLILILSVLAAGGLAVCPSFAQSGDTQAKARHFVIEGSPEATLAGKTGDLCSDLTGAATYLKTGGASSVGWVKVVAAGGTLVTGTSVPTSPTAGTLLLTGTSLTVYLTNSTGLIIKSGTVTTF